jgi:ammonia channel protein AmtB
MDEFSYLSVLLSIILGLAVTQILQGFRGLLLSRTRIKIYWPVIAWAILLLLVCFQSWWTMFGMRMRHDWTFAQFSIVLLQTIVTYMLAGLVFPDLSGDKVVDLRESFYAHRGWFFAFGFASIAVSVIKEVVLAGRLPHPLNLAFHVLFAVTLLVGAVTRRERYHKILVVCGIATFLLYIAILYARLE